MVIVYHGSNMIINRIDLSRCRWGTDFGKGFYTTSSLKHARKRAEYMVKRSGGTPTVMVYELMDYSDLFVQDLGEEANLEWLNFITNNRLHPKFKHDYDIVVGLIADGATVEVVSEFASLMKRGRVVDWSGFIARLKPYKNADQYSFHTSDSLKVLVPKGVV